MDVWCARRLLSVGIIAALALAATAGCSDKRSPSPTLRDTDPAARADATPSDTGPTGGDDTSSPDTASPLDAFDTDRLDTSPVDDIREPDTARDTRDAAPPDTSAETGVDTVDAPVAQCGDGRVEGNEACDDGNTTGGDYCAPDCSTVTGSCGDGTLQSNESCDDGNITTGCDTKHDGGDGTCQPPGQCSQGYIFENGKCIEKQLDKHVHIYISNTCKLSVTPKSVDVPRGQTVSFVYHNHSSDYAADVWLSYGGGFTDLQKGKSWDDQFIHCSNVNRPYSAYADITIKGLSLRDRHCPGHRMTINCK